MSPARLKPICSDNAQPRVRATRPGKRHSRAWSDYAHLGPGQSVLVHGAAGNVGAYAVQFARLVRARAIATARPSDIDCVYGLHADEVIDYRATRFEDDLEPVDVVIDTVGGEVQRRSLSVIKPGGILVSSVSKPDPQEAKRRGVRAEFILVGVTTSALARIASLVDAGEISTNVGAVLPWIRPAPHMR